MTFFICHDFLDVTGVNSQNVYKYISNHDCVKIRKHYLQQKFLGLISSPPHLSARGSCPAPVTKPLCLYAYLPTYLFIYLSTCMSIHQICWSTSYSYNLFRQNAIDTYMNKVMDNCRSFNVDKKRNTNLLIMLSFPIDFYLFKKPSIYATLWYVMLFGTANIFMESNVYCVNERLRQQKGKKP